MADENNKIEKAPILQSKADTGATSGTVTLPVVKPEKTETALPESMKGVTFSDAGVDDFVVEQLPEHTPAGEKGGIKTKDEVTEKKEGGEVKVEKLGEEEKEPEVKFEDEKKEEKEEKKSDVPKWLKPPTGKGGTDTSGKKAEVKAIVPPDKKTTRDYTGYTPEQVVALKQMSNEGFALATAAIKENRELAKLRESTYMQHEQGYVLDPGFQQIRGNVQQANSEAQYWQQQLALIKDGKKWTPITGLNTKTGQFVKGPEQEPTAGAEEEVRLMMNNAYRVSQELTGQLQTYPQRYKQQVSQDLQEIEAIRKQQFGWVSNPELLDYTVDMPGVGEIPLRKIKEDFINMYPPYMRAHPAVQITGDLMIALRLKSAELKAAQATQQVDETIAKEKSRVEPTSGQKPKNLNGVAVHGVKEFTDDLATL